jgi:hypothetical protein
MKNKIAACAVFVALLLAALGFTYQQSPAKWDYKVVTMPADGGDKYDTDFLVSNGLLGWELVTVESRGRDRTYFFKRAR